MGKGAEGFLCLVFLMELLSSCTVSETTLAKALARGKTGGLLSPQLRLELKKQTAGEECMNRINAWGTTALLCPAHCRGNNLVEVAS